MFREFIVATDLSPASDAVVNCLSGLKIAVTNPEMCVVLCDKCAGFCPNEAISFPDREETKQSIIKQLKEVQN